MTAVVTPTAPANPPPAQVRWRVAVPVVVALLAAAGALGSHLLFVRTWVGQAVDEAAMRGAEVRHPQLIEVLHRTLDGTSLVSLGIASLIAATIALMRRRLDLAVGAGVLVLGANLTTRALKLNLDRPPLAAPGPNSWPSGHTTAAVSVAFALVLVLPYAMRAAVALAGTLYSTVIAVATVWAAWHRPSDTVAALLVVLGWGALVVGAIQLRRTLVRRQPDTGRSASRLATMPLTLGATVSGAVGTIGLAAVLLSETVLPGLVSPLAPFVAASAAIAGASAATFLIWVRLAAGDVPANEDA
ncbi:MAG TPA: phosphatase PAP2 family protein [Actinoplanes sp.]|nr:phosphatase PAP2 family protein [Actinoplanes sp.]